MFYSVVILNVPVLYFVFSLMIVQKKPKHIAEFLILITNICCCIIDGINYCIIGKHSGMALIKAIF